MKKLIILLIVTICSFCEATDLHMIYVADTNDPYIGNGVENDLYGMQT